MVIGGDRLHYDLSTQSITNLVPTYLRIDVSAKLMFMLSWFFKSVEKPIRKTLKEQSVVAEQ